MRVLVFAPYLEKGGELVSPHYDPPEYRAELGSWFEALGARWEWVPITSRTLDAEIQRARGLAAVEDLVVFNICDGTISDGYPGIEVVAALEANALPYTGAGEYFYRVTTSKTASKTCFKAAGVSTSPWVLARTEEDIDHAAATLPFPLFVKPDVSAGSYGIQIDSVVRDSAALHRQFNAVRAGLHGQTFEDDAVLVERFIEGREFTVLVVEDSNEPLGLYVLPPGERVFDAAVPPQERFLAYERYWGEPDPSRLIPELPAVPCYRYALAPPDLSPAITDLARRSFRAVDGNSYARVDMRFDERTKELFVLEVNAQCGLSTDDNSTVGSLLALSKQPMPPVIARILRHAMNRVINGAANAAPYIPVFIAYTEQDGLLVSPEYEESWVREEIDEWMRALHCDWEWVAVSNANLESVIEKVTTLSRQRPTVVLNLCDGDDVNGYPGLSVVNALEAAGIRFTGARSRFYDLSTSKRTTKERLQAAGVRTTRFVMIQDGTDIEQAGQTLGWPVFIKPDVAAGSAGITEFSRANNLEEGRRAVEKALANMDEYESWVGGLIAEPFLAGREFTVLVVRDPAGPEGLHGFVPVERVFSTTTTVDERFLTSDRVMSEGDEESEVYSYAPAPVELRDELVDLARRAMQAVEGTGYARVDIRYDADPGVPYVLEVNANCGISGDPSSAVGSILQHSDVSISSFIGRIIADAMVQPS
jgi:D-alanine-D-alanine ligase